MAINYALANLPNNVYKQNSPYRRYELFGSLATVFANGPEDLVWFGGFYGISTFVGYLTPNPFLCK